VTHWQSNRHPGSHVAPLGALQLAGAAHWPASVQVQPACWAHVPWGKVAQDRTIPVQLEAVGVHPAPVHSVGLLACAWQLCANPSQLW
jgi:hypothetical protein